MLRYFLLGLLGFLVFSRRAKSAPLTVPAQRISGGVPIAQAQTVFRQLPVSSAQPAKTNDTLTLATKAAQMAISATNASSSIYGVATTGAAGWGATFSLVGIPFAAKGIFDLAGGSAPEFGTDFLTYAKAQVQNAGGAVTYARKNPLSIREQQSYVHGPGDPLPKTPFQIYQESFRTNNPIIEKAAYANVSKAAVAPALAKQKYWQTFVDAYENGTLATNPTLLASAQNEWKNYVGANSGY